MLKTIAFLVVVGALIWFFYKKNRAAPRVRQSTDDQAAPQSMVTCHQCRLNIPESEAIYAQGHHYCCDEHRRLDR